MIGRQNAGVLHARHEGIIFPVDAEAIALKEGLTTQDWEFLPPVEEVKVGGWIGIRTGLSDRWRRWNIAHALGHHLMHRGNQLAFRGGQRANCRKQEHEAEEFAAHFLMPEKELEKIRDYEVWELAEYFGVPEKAEAHHIRCRRRAGTMASTG